jgi:hypothetical protein
MDNIMIRAQDSPNKLRCRLREQFQFPTTLHLGMEARESRPTWNWDVAALLVIAAFA